MATFLEELRKQRWDDHRYYHQSRINQTLHLVSACCFLGAYALCWTDPVIAAYLGWILAMISRQLGHFLLRTERLRPNQPRDARTQGRHQGRLQPEA